MIYVKMLVLDNGKPKNMNIWGQNRWHEKIVLEMKIIFLTLKMSHRVDVSSFNTTKMKKQQVQS